MNNAMATTQSNEAQFIMIGDTRIEMKDGAYSLNDLHKASGTPASKNPSAWFRNKGTQAFLSATQIYVAVQNGNGSSTYGEKKAVYHYAMWISPMFQSQVIDVFDAVVTGKLKQPELTGDTMLDMMSVMIESRKEHIALSNKVNQQEVKLAELEERTTILPSKPVNAESISYIRVRINKKHGLPSKIVDEVLRGSPYSPKPAGQVKNKNENASNSTFTVWYVSDITKLFNRFCSECEMKTKTKASHPSIDGQFKLTF